MFTDRQLMTGTPYRGPEFAGLGGRVEAVVQAKVDLENAQNQARACGCEDLFEAMLIAEAARCLPTLAKPLTPLELVKIAIAVTVSK